MKHTLKQHRAFIQNYNETKDKVFSFFYFRLAQDSAVAEDLTSDTFLKAYDKFDTYREEYAFSTWVFTIARNTLTDHYRSVGKRDTVSLEEAEDTPSTLFSPEEFSNTILERELIESAIAELTDLQQECIRRRFFEQQSTKEIAANTNTTEDNVRQSISRGIKKLRELLTLIEYQGGEAKAT